MGTSAIFKKLGDLEQEVVSDIYPGSKSKHLFTTNSCMIMKQCLQENRYQNPVYKGATTAYHSAAVLRKAARYALHANAAYFADQNKICEAVPGLGPEHIVHIENSSKIGQMSCHARACRTSSSLPWLSNRWTT